MWEKLWHILLEYATSIGLKLLFALALLVIGLKIIKKVKKWIQNTEKLERIDDGVRTFAVSFTGIVLYIVLFISIAMILGVPTTSFITLLASSGVAIGLAMQGALSNFAGGLMLLLFKPFKVGDFVEAGDKSGTVQEITVVYTVLVTPDNKRVTIPNGTLTNSEIINYSAEPTRRVDLTFTTAYTCDIEITKDVLLQVANAHPLVLTEPDAPVARLQTQGDSALIYTLRVWCKSEDYWTVYFDLNETVKRTFDEKGILIPFPQMDVHIDQK